MPSPADLAAALNLHPLVAEVLWQRGCHDEASARAFLDFNRYTPAPAAVLPDMDRAIARLQAAIAGGEHIRIWGDFDVDGQTATSVLLLGLQRLGAHVDFTIPDRATHSHGLNRDGVQQAAADGVHVLLTCDCGIAEFDDIAFAMQLGLDVIVSDHHDLVHADDGQPLLPAALAVVNPKRLPPDHALSQLPGVGVAYKVIEALAQALAPESPPNDLLDLVALGIVTDVAQQRGDTRYLLQAGLHEMRRAPRPGVRALLKVANIEAHNIDADSVAYQLGPRLNAAGRLAHAALSVELLTTTEEARAAEIATQIEQLNAERRALQKTIEAAASEMIERDPDIVTQPAIVLHAPDWPASVIGIVASSLSERHHKPAIMISVKPGEIGRASARSVEGVDIHAAIAATGDLTVGGGGHPMAAGFGIHFDNVQPFIAAVGLAVAEQLAANQPASGVEIAAVEHFRVPWRDATLPLAEQLERLAPFGAGNPRPLLHSDGLHLVRAEPLGKDGKHQALFLTDGADTTWRAAWWRGGHRQVPGPETPLALDFTLRRDVYRDKVRAQIEVVNLHVLATNAARADAATTANVAGFRIVDLRSELDRDAALARLQAEFGEDNIALWKTGAPPAEPRAVLALWDAPAGPDELRALLQHIQPGVVALLVTAPDASGDTVDTITPQVLGMFKVSQKRGESIDDPVVLGRMAARINQRTAAVRAALDAHIGDLNARAALNFVLEETRAYRKYLAEAPAAEVLRVGYLQPKPVQPSS